MYIKQYTHGSHALLIRMKNRVYCANQYDMILKSKYTKQVSNIDECVVLVLPVHSRETRLVSFLSRLVSFLSRRVSRETRRVSRDGGNLLLIGTVILSMPLPAGFEKT